MRRTSPHTPIDGVNHAAFPGHTRGQSTPSEPCGSESSRSFSLWSQTNEDLVEGDELLGSDLFLIVLDDILVDVFVASRCKYERKFEEAQLSGGQLRCSSISYQGLRLRCSANYFMVWNGGRAA